ncbi:peptidoglycan hydrolase [Burkholderia sp. Ac-20379]|uniref:peptidoglycan hydrolase n=1 Tax=Burkholderia sp. Ac-20379 TaxID=2703900 RepID=UPI001980BA1C|nr:peptidoglycan hydrolase [Burkholderia sp. Ac-20379]MBN3727296.1 peptidoglycan hydrolase [Burkholderia sp. Ac-20379]
MRASRRAAGQAADARAALEHAAEQFEGMFIAQMLGAMREATATLGGSGGERDDTAGALLDHAYREVANGIATQRAFGIADTLIAQMLPAAGAPDQPIHPFTKEQGP